jgi:hypothetical protein
MSSPRLHKPPPPSLADALELLRRVLAEAPDAALPGDTRARITQLLLGASAASDEAALDTTTEVERPRIRLVRLPPRHYLVLQRALRSPTLAGTFADLHDFMLSAARGYSYQPAPDLSHVDVRPGIPHAVVFAALELQELEPRARAAGAPSLDTYVLGCSFHWLSALQQRWPDDAHLNNHQTPDRPWS